MTIPGRKFNAGEIAYGDWFPRQADNAIFRAQSLDWDDDLNIKVEFETKNMDEAGDPALPVSGKLIELGTPGPPESEVVTGLKELVRYKISTVSGTEWILTRFFPPVWYDDAT